MSERRITPASARTAAVRVRPAGLLAVFLGGACGTAARAALTALIPAAAGVPVATLLINVVGAFLLGLVFAALRPRTPKDSTTGYARGHERSGERARSLRLLLGTGFLGGFTTYSALAADTASLFGQSTATAALLYSLGTLLAGMMAAWAGGASAALLPRRLRSAA